MEIDILKKKMEKARVEFYRNSEEYQTEDDLEIMVDIPFSEIIFAITNKIKRSDLLNMTDQDLIKHIQFVQLLES